LNPVALPIKLRRVKIELNHRESSQFLVFGERGKPGKISLKEWMQPLCVTVHIMFRLKIEDNREVTFIQLDKRIVSFFLGSYS